MNLPEQELEKIVAQLLMDLDQVRARTGNAWPPLVAALEPVLKALGVESAFAGEDLAATITWEKSIQSLDDAVAGDVSRALVRFSESLTKHYRSVTPRDRRVSNALAQIYLDVERPLWAVYPALAPMELRE